MSPSTTTPTITTTATATASSTSSNSSSSNIKCSRVSLSLAVFLCLSVLLHSCAASVPRSVLRKAFNCPPCSTSRCPPLPYTTDCDPVLEPGVCACCFRCAQRLGEACGFNEGRCAKTLSCLPPLDTVDIYQAFLDGTAVCAPFPDRIPL